jgi:hypothetical protein
MERGELTERVPCIVLDVSAKGLRIRSANRLSPGQIIDFVSDGRNDLRCRVVWTGDVGSIQSGQAGLRITVRNAADATLIQDLAVS